MSDFEHEFPENVDRKNEDSAQDQNKERDFTQQDAGEDFSKNESKDADYVPLADDPKEDDIYVEAQEVEDPVEEDQSVWKPAAESVDPGEGQYHYTKETLPDNYTGGAEKKRGGSMKKIVKIVASALLFGVIAGGAMIGVSVAKDQFFPSNIAKVQTTDASDDSSKESSTGTSSSDTVTSQDVSGIVDQVMPSVVSITCTIESTNYFFGGTTESEGAGSGFIIAKDSKNLYIATNNHVVSDASSLTVGFIDDTTVSAQVVGTDTDADLAVISVKAEDISKKTASAIKVAVLGDSDAMKVGEPVIAIGNALGYGQSVTTGVVSAKNREVSFTDGTMTLLQTDAAINPGNSGGVLVNLNGEVIGINNAKLEDTSVEGMGYAIPMSTAKGILTDLMNATTVTEGQEAFLGVVGKDIDSTYSQALGMPSGIYVSQVVDGSPAEKAGISAGDVITGFEGNNVSTMSGLKEKLARKKAGTKVKVTIKRANQNGEYEEKTISVTLGKKSDFADATTETQTDDQQSGSGNGNSNGNSGNSDDSQDYYTNPYDYFFGNGNGGSSDNNGGYYYYYNK